MTIEPNHENAAEYDRVCIDGVPLRQYIYVCLTCGCYMTRCRTIEIPELCSCGTKEKQWVWMDNLIHNGTNKPPSQYIMASVTPLVYLLWEQKQCK